MGYLKKQKQKRVISRFDAKTIVKESIAYYEQHGEPGTFRVNTNEASQKQLLALIDQVEKEAKKQCYQMYLEVEQEGDCIYIGATPEGNAGQINLI